MMRRLVRTNTGSRANILKKSKKEFILTIIYTIQRKHVNLVLELKVLTNENRGGLNLVSFDRSPFKLFSLRFSNKSVQAPSRERPKTAQRTLFLLFANKDCNPISASCPAATNFPHHTLICNNGISVHPPRYLR
jgi:hypothetical protein